MELDWIRQVALTHHRQKRFELTADQVFAAEVAVAAATEPQSTP